MTRRAPVVLLVDDSESDAFTFARYLRADEDASYEVLVAVDGESGVDLALTRHPDVVLLDYDLPDVDGLEFLAELGARGGPGGPVVLAVTGQSDPRVAASLIRGGALDYVSKSDVTGEGLRLAVRQALRARQLRDEVVRREEERESSRRALLASLERASYLARASEALAHVLDVDRVVEIASELAVPALAAACFIDVVEERGLRRAFVRVTDPAAPAIPLEAPQRGVDQGAWRVVRTGATATYVESWLPVLARADEGVALLAGAGLAHDAMVLPLTFGGTPVGALTLLSCDAGSAYARSTAEEFARRVAAALANAHGFAAERSAKRHAEEAQRRLSVLSRASVLFTNSLDAEATLRTLSRQLVPLFADYVVIVLSGEGPENYRYFTAAEDGRLEALSVSLLSMFEDLTSHPAGAGVTIRSGATEFYPDRTMHELRWRGHPLADAVARRNLSSYLSVPMRRQDGVVIGALVAGTLGERRLTVEDVAIAEDLGRRAGAYVETAQLFERERNVARALQESLLPRSLPRIERLALAARNISGVAGVDVGGDWYDVVRRRDGWVSFALGDVAGRGVDAAAAMGQLRSALRAYALEGLEPEEALARLNEFMLSEDKTAFATVLCGMMDAETGTCRIASAGHLPPIVVGIDGDSRIVDLRPALPVGIDADARYDRTFVVLEPGETLVLYTDGVVETKERSLDDGIAAMRAFAAERPRDLEEFVDGLVEEIAGTGDDVTVLALRFVAEAASPARLSLRYPAVPQSGPVLRRRLRRLLADAEVDPVTIGDAELATGEAIANAVEHAYGTEPGAIGFEAEVIDGFVRIAIRDDGHWRVPVRADGVLHERGRGLALMRALAYDVEVEASEEGTAVVLRFPVHAAATR